MRHTKGPFDVKNFDESQAALIPVKTERQPLVAIISIGFDRPDSEGNCELLKLWDTAPHACEDPHCPGEENRRKLEAAEEMAEVLRLIDESGTIHDEFCCCPRSDECIGDCKLLRKALARWEGKP